jgi:hypothetical protein
MIHHSTNQLEINMSLFSSTAQSPRIRLNDRRVSPDIAFAVWMSVALIGLAILSVASGVAPITDPETFVFAEPSK